MATYRYRLPRLLLNSDIPSVPRTTYVNNNNNNSSSTNISYNDSDATNFDSNMVIILAALLCALICALGLNSIVRCAVRCTWARDTAGEVAAPHDLSSSSGADPKKEALAAVVEIPVVVYKSGICIPAATECTICLGEFVEGEDVRILPKCNHGFHVKCIDRWLLLQCSCPICRVRVS